MSLSESLVALAIMAITMAASVPSLIRTREVYALHSAARMVESRMQSAKIRAVTRNQDCRINVTSSASYVVECQGTSWTTIESVSMPPGITVTASARPEFHARGNVAPTGTLTVWDKTGRNIRVIVNVNGRIRLQ
jgi:Tfp pilus assembly protein FimT